MSTSPCYLKLQDYLKENGSKLSSKAVLEIAQMLDKKRADLLTGTAFRGEAEKMVAKQLTTLADQNRLTRIMELEKAVNADRMIVDTAGGQTKIDNLISYLVGGSAKIGNSVNRSVMDMKVAYKAQLLSVFERGIEGDLDAIKSGQLQKEIWQELWAVESGMEAGKSGSQIAVRVAKALNATMNEIYGLKKAVNPYMEKISEYLVKTFHDRDKVSAVSKEEWVADANATYGKNSFPQLTPEQKLEVFGDIYDRIKSGTYGSLLDHEEYASVLPNKTEFNLMKKMNSERRLIANDWEAAHNYGKKYGPGNIFDSVEKMIDQTSRDVAHLEKFSSKPQEFIDGRYQKILQSATTAEEKQKIKSQKPTIDANFRAAMGQSDAPATGALGRKTRGLLGLNNLILTGTAWFRMAPGDLMNTARIFKASNGDNLYSNAFRVAGAYIKQFAFTSSEDTSKALKSLYMFSHLSIANLMDGIGAASENPGSLAKMNDLMGTFSGATRHHNAMRATIGSLLSSDLAEISGQEHAGLTKAWKENLLRYGIGENEWDVLRQGVQDWNALKVTKAPIEMKFLNMDGVKSIPDEFFENYLLKQKFEPSQINANTINRARWDLSNKLGVMINDYANIGSSTPGLREKAFMYKGMDINTPEGAMRRLLFQFKSASLVNARSYQRAYFSGAAPAKGAYFGLANDIAMSAFLWTMGEYAKQAIEGKTPQDPTQDLTLIPRAILGSGAAGIWGDAISADLNARSGSDWAKSILLNTAGPTVGTALSAGGIAWDEAHHIANPSVAAPSAKTASLIWKQVPNLWATKAVLNYYVGNGFKEFMGPGYLGHLEQQVMQSGQSYWIGSPTNSPRGPVPPILEALTGR